MMISRPDAQLTFGAASVTSGTATCADVLKLDAADPARMRVVANVTTAFAGGTSIVLKVQGSDDNSSFTDVAVTPSIALADLTKNASFDVAIPSSWSNKYMRVAAVATGTFTAGAIEAFLDVYQGA